MRQQEQHRQAEGDSDIRWAIHETRGRILGTKIPEDVPDALVQCVKNFEETIITTTNKIATLERRKQLLDEIRDITL